LKNEGPLAFYKVMLLILYAVLSLILLGHVSTMLGIGVCGSIQFGVLEYAKRIFTAQNLARGEGG
jgi:solute carrier family 25 carnitine/acylcarnitine transporter 20/29